MIGGDGGADPGGEDWAGDVLLHPVALVAVAVLVANDRLLKQRWPGLVTGKLSDVAGMVFFPLLLVALAELAGHLGGRTWRAEPRTIATIAAVVGLTFAATKVVAPVRAVDEAVLGWLRWAPPAAARTLAGTPPGAPVRHRVAADPSDLVAVPFVLVAVWIGARRRPHRHGEAAETETDQLEA